MPDESEGKSARGDPGDKAGTSHGRRSPRSSGSREDAELAPSTAASLTEEIRSQFSEDELKRLRTLAEQPKTSSAWVLRRLLRHLDS